MQASSDAGFAQPFAAKGNPERAPRTPVGRTAQNGGRETMSSLLMATVLCAFNWAGAAQIAALGVHYALLAAGGIAYEFSRQDAVTAISNLNTYNLIFIMVGLLLHWRPKRFLAAVGRAVPATAGVLIQFPLYGAIAIKPHTGEKRRRGGSVRPDCPRLRQRVNTAHVSPADRDLLRHSGFLRPVRRRQVASGRRLT